ncbi:MAG: hypothetical protein WCK49_09430 [Myxococcaceae bacterium]
MLKIILPVGVLLVSQLALAAIPPLSKDMREREASHIVEGQVISIDKELVSEDWHMTAAVRVNKFIKVDMDTDAEAEKIRVKYWKPAKRPNGWTGSQGQNGWMSAGEEVRLFMTKDDETDTYDLLMPNGWEPLVGTQSNYLDNRDLDDVDLYDLETRELEVEMEED